MTALDEPLFDRIAAAELKYLEKHLGDLDPDEAEVEFSLDVLTITLGSGDKIVVNSHRAARQIWMAAFRRAWHFNPVPPSEGEGAGATWRWTTPRGDELRSTLGGLLTEKLGKPVTL